MFLPKYNFSKGQSVNEVELEEVPIINVVFPSSMISSAKELQPSNALPPMEVTLLGIVKEVKPQQPEKAEEPMEVTLLGIVNPVNPVQPEKA